MTAHSADYGRAPWWVWVGIAVVSFVLSFVFGYVQGKCLL